MSLVEGKGAEQTQERQPVRLGEGGGGLTLKERKHFQEVRAPVWPTLLATVGPSFLEVVTW